MSGYLSLVMAEAHAADLGEQARRARAHHIRTGPRRPSRLRNSTARLLFALAVRLDDRRTAVRASTSGAGT
jgi:hypothetical protein